MRLFLTGLMLSIGAELSAQTASEIYLFDVDQRGDQIAISGGRNITQHAGYDNQPFFHPTETVLYYSSFDSSGRSDIKRYNYSTGQTEFLTATGEREYSPTVTPDRKYISCIIQRDTGAQDLGKYPVGGGPPVILIDDLVVGYHAWMSDHQLILFVLGDTMTLRTFDLTTGQHQTIAENIGRSLHRIPGEDAMSFVDKSDADQWLIKRFDIQTQAISDMVPTLPGREDLTWTPDGRILMSDGRSIWMCNPLKLRATADVWRPIDGGPTELHGISRLALSADGKRLALVADE